MTRRRNHRGDGYTRLLWTQRDFLSRINRLKWKDFRDLFSFGDRFRMRVSGEDSRQNFLANVWLSFLSSIIFFWLFIPLSRKFFRSWGISWNIDLNRNGTCSLVWLVIGSVSLWNFRISSQNDGLLNEVCCV